MKNLIINRVSIPDSIEEDFNKNRTTWIDDKLVEFDEGSHIIYYIDHKNEYIVDEIGKEKLITLAYPIRVEKPITRDKIIMSAVKDAYCLSSDEDITNFQLKLLQENNDSSEVIKYREFISWVNNNLNIAKGISIEDAKKLMIEKINNYDESENVNSFILNGHAAWLDKNTRVGLMNSISIEKQTGHDKTTLWLGLQSFTIQIELAINLLNQLELYAKDCYNKTAEHKYHIEQLTTVNDILNYDFTEGYPKKLKITL